MHLSCLKDKESWLILLNNNTTLINVLGHIVEFRNNESGLHVQHIQTITKLLLLALTKRTDKYKINDYDILKISTASLHDVGKIAIDEKIINKSGKLTSEEFEIMKTHTVIGAEMIQKIANYEENELLNMMTQKKKYRFLKMWQINLVCLRNIKEEHTLS